MRNIQTTKSTRQKHSHSNPTPSNQELWRELVILRAVDGAAHRSRSRFAVRKYLLAVYHTYRRWQENADPEQRARRAAALCGVAIRQGTHPLKVLIDLTTAEPDPKVRSRWGRALELAETEGVKASEFLRYLRQVKGVAGAARKMSSLYGRTRRNGEWDDDTEVDLDDQYS